MQPPPEADRPTQPRLLEEPEQEKPEKDPAPSWNSATVRILSVPEPLATLILLGVKKIYTTGRYTRHTGPTLIYTPGLGRLPVERIPSEALRAIEGREMHRQAVFGHVTLKVAAPTEGLNPRFEHHRLTPIELALDDFSADRYALYLQEPHWLNEPLRTSPRGQLARADQHTLDAVARQLAGWEASSPAGESRQKPQTG